MITRTLEKPDITDMIVWSGRSKPGMPVWTGPKEIRDEFLKRFGIDFVSSYLDTCEWIDASKQIIPPHAFGADKLLERSSGLIKALKLTVFLPPHTQLAAK